MCADFLTQGPLVQLRAGQTDLRLVRECGFSCRPVSRGLGRCLKYCWSRSRTPNFTLRYKMKPPAVRHLPLVRLAGFTVYGRNPHSHISPHSNIQSIRFFKHSKRNIFFALLNLSSVYSAAAIKGEIQVFFKTLCNLKMNKTRFT